ncbi:Zn-dependent hydrolase [Komagataeibacter sp. FNDCF1]|uniref:Zn-dependent hydrolase n=1 Tax=Komagataeibacter sp. FNDCF1 TaxID=2878681 RepID=UPI001E63398B|nr:Zn-dependent hydrolase [Komagataeibacter sp. FNDCF1]MCE2563305.1 Zn-dependent hydrolase [Komagataeibacter sp. FNDCF1]
MTSLSVNSGRLLADIHELGAIGRETDGRLTRLALSDADRLGRDHLVARIRAAGLEVAIDQIGNIFGIWTQDRHADQKPVLLGSHIDTVINAGIYDGCYGVIAGLEVIRTLREAGFTPPRPIAVAAFTNEEGVRFSPDMMGSLVYAGGLDIKKALATRGTDGTVLADELVRIGYAGPYAPGFLAPHAYVELHIEQGPVLEHIGSSIGAVADLQGISWQRITIEGQANHAGTTPMALRRDAGHAAARIMTFIHDRASRPDTSGVATVGTIAFEPNAINVIPARATLTIDLRNPDENRLVEEEDALSRFLSHLQATGDVKIHVEKLARSAPVRFDPRIVALIEDVASRRGLASRRMTSGAGHDAQMIAGMAPAAMIFVPSRLGISHNPEEFTSDEALVAGANVLLDVVRHLAHET